MADGINIDVLKASGKKGSKKTLSAEVFGAEVAGQLLHQTVRWQRAKKRAGTHTVKTRSQVRGGGKKPWRQKGTGRARAGSTSSPVWVGGGVAHGPKQRSYEFSLNRKEKRQALCAALTARASEGRIVLVDDFGLKEIKTKAAVEVLKAVGVAAGETALVVVAAESEVLKRSLKNIARVKAVEVAGLNVYDLLNAKHVVVVGDAIDGIEARLSVK